MNQSKIGPSPVKKDTAAASATTAQEGYAPNHNQAHDLLGQNLSIIHQSGENSRFYVEQKDIDANNELVDFTGEQDYVTGIIDKQNSQVSQNSQESEEAGEIFIKGRLNRKNTQKQTQQPMTIAENQKVPDHRGDYEGVDISLENFQIMQSQESIFANQQNMTQLQGSDDEVTVIRAESQIVTNMVDSNNSSDESDKNNRKKKNKPTFVETKLLGEADPRSDQQLLKSQMTGAQKHTISSFESISSSQLGQGVSKMKSMKMMSSLKKQLTKQLTKSMIKDPKALMRSQSGIKKSQSNLDQSNLQDGNRSMAGFEMGQTKSQSSFYSSVRQRQNHGGMKGFVDTSRLSGAKFIEQTIKQQQNRYEKKFAFEKGKYHQCIPNPKNPRQRITVQLLDRVLKETASQFGPNQLLAQMFENEQNVSSTSLSQTYERFNLVPPGDNLDQNQDQGEGEDDEDDGDDQSSQQLIVKASPRGGNNDGGRRPSVRVLKKLVTQYGSVDTKLYSNKSLFNEVSKLLGIQNSHYADIKNSSSNELSSQAREDCDEFAVVAFWDLTSVDTFKCNRFFIIPNPHKRIVKDSSGTLVYRVLYTSEQTQDVFFFYKGKNEQTCDDLKEFQDEKVSEKGFNIAFLELSLSDQEIERIGEIRQLNKHCRPVHNIAEDSILTSYLKQLHEQPLSEQHQMADLTIIYNPIDFDKQRTLENPYREKLVVFTAFKLEECHSSNYADTQSNKILDNWYPTTFFYDYINQKTAWEIYGAEQFIGTHKTTVYFLTNQVWSEANEEDYNSWKKDDPVFTRHENFTNYFKKIKFGTSIEINDFQNLKLCAPIQPVSFQYRLMFDKHSNLEVTDPFKIVSAHAHAQMNRVTLVYEGLGSFTFALRRACSLTQKSLWQGSFNNAKFSCQLTFSAKDKKIHGEGQDEYEQKVIIEAGLSPKNQAIWAGHIESQDIRQDFTSPAVDFTKQGSKTLINSHWVEEDGTQYKLAGRLGKKDLQQGEQVLIFTLKTQIEGKKVDLDFSGTIDLLRSKISGELTQKDQKGISLHFEMNLVEVVPGWLSYKLGDKEPVIRDIVVDYQAKTIECPEGNEPDLSIEAIEAVDSAELTYSILREDVKFLRSEGKAYIQARLTALADADNTSNGQGVTETSAILYCVDAETAKKDKDQTKKKLAGEPKQRQNARFYLDQSFLRTQQKNDVQMWHVCQPYITLIDGKQRIFGSVLYEEYGSDEVRLNMWSAYLDSESESEEKQLEYFQEPVPQSWIVDYPLLAYKTFTPRNKEIAIVHMAYNMPQRILHLGEWEFVCFVNHTQMVEQKCFKKSKETNCDIMILVKRTSDRKDGNPGFEQCRLISFKSNPWLQYHEEPDDTDQDIYKQSFFIFSGDIGVIPTEDWEGNRVDQNLENHLKFSQRFNNDKVQNCQLITKTLGTYEQYMLIIQFNDCIVQASLNRNFFKLICKPEQMIRRHLVRGYNEKVFFAESSGKVDKIYQIEFHPTKTNEITCKEIYQLASGWLVAFEPDDECIQNDMKEGVTQSFFVIDDQQKIYFLKNEDNVRFEVKKVIDFSRHKKAQEIDALRDNDWSHVHITQRTLTMGGVTYNLNTNLNFDQTIPKAYFGKEMSSNQIMNDESVMISDSNSDEESSDDSEEEDHDAWEVSTQQGMSMTTNMILVAQRNQREFCFVIKPAPGSRKISIVGFQQLHEIREMLFVSNQHILLKFQGGKTVTLLSNGSIIHQEARVQDLLEASERVIGESQIFRGKKTLLLEDEYGEKNEQIRYIALQFELSGLAKCVGIFDDFKKQMKHQLEKRKQILDEKYGTGTSEQLQRQQSDHQLERVVTQAYDTINIELDKSAFGANKNNLKFVDKAKKNKILYAKEYFVTEKGEVIKMAAMITHHPEVKKRLEATQAMATAGKKAKISNKHTKEHFISIFKIANNQDMKTSFNLDDESMNAFTVIVFHTLDQKSQTEFVTNTQYCVVGNYLCHRNRDQQVIWVSKLKENVDDLIQAAISDDSSADITDNYFKEYKSRCLSIDKMTRKVFLPHIQLTEVPKAYFTTIKSINSGGQINFYDNLLQVTVSTNGIIYDLDSNPIKEVDAIENIDQLQKPDYCVNTGFIMSVSSNVVEDEVSYRKRTQIITNEYCNLLFQKIQHRTGEIKSEERETKISGMLYRSFSSVDLQELAQIQHSIDDRAKIIYIDPEAILAQYEGNTIFSIFFDRIQVYEKILGQLKDYELPGEEDINGLDVENSFLRRLYRTVTMPSGDLHHYKQKFDTESIWNKSFRKRSASLREKSFTEKAKQWLTKRCQGEQEQKVNPRQGFKSILKKSIYFSQARFRESLMEMAMLCKENAINNFVENLEDIKVLFVSMSPAVVAQFENAFKSTKFTDSVQNADWRIGEQLEVIGQMSSIIMEKDATKQIRQSQKKLLSDKGDVQNRQVEAKMLPIDWIFAPCNGKTQVGFADFVVALAQAPHESLFSTDLIETLVDHFWSRYYIAVILKCFIPFLVYMVCTLYYISNYAVTGVENPDEFSAEMVLRYLIIILILYFCYFEVRCMIRDKLSYLLDVYNYIDIGTFILNFYLIRSATSAHNLDQDEKRQIRTLSSIAALFMWTKSFYWLRLFGPTSFFVRLIGDTLHDIRYFLILFVLILMTFGNAVLILSEGREDKLYRDYSSIEYINVVLNQYELSLGEFDTENYLSGGEGGDSIAWILFCVATLITQIMFLNMLIAIMGDTFDRVTESKEQSALVEKIRILADYVYVVPAESIEKGTLSRFLFVIRPKALGTDESGGWTGTTTILKQAIQDQSITLQKQINNRMNSMQSDVGEGYRKIELLEDRLSDLNGASQRQQGMIEQVLKQQKEILEHLNVSKDTISQV